MESRPSVARFSAALAVAVIMLVAIGLTAPAFAAQEPVLTDQQRTQLTQELAAFRGCLQQHGVTLPEHPGLRNRLGLPMLTDQQRAALEEARTACGDLRPERPVLTDQQRAALRAQFEAHRACLQEHGVTLPEHPGLRNRLGLPMLTDQQRAALDEARTACGDVRPNLGLRDQPDV